jgi:hypothetical protein
MSNLSRVESHKPSRYVASHRSKAGSPKRSKDPNASASGCPFRHFITWTSFCLQNRFCGWRVGGRDSGSRGEFIDVIGGTVGNPHWGVSGKVVAQTRESRGERSSRSQNVLNVYDRKPWERGVHVCFSLGVSGKIFPQISHDS